MLVCHGKKQLNKKNNIINEAEEIKKIVAKFIEDFDKVQWGWDGDCGTNDLVEKLGEEVLGDIFINAPDIGRFVSPWGEEAERYNNRDENTIFLN